VLFSTDKEGVIRELDATITYCEQYLSEEERVKRDLEDSKALKGQLDTTYKDKQETDARFKEISDWQNRMGGSLKFFGGPPSFVYLCTIERAFRARKPLKNTMCVSQEHDVRFP
jgi:hypothetical protein